MRKNNQSIATKVLSWLKRNGSKPKAVPMLAGLSIGDFFIPALPTQTSVMLLAWLQPQQRVFIALLFAMAAVIGSGILIGLSLLLESFIQASIPSEQSDFYAKWLQLKAWINDYGLLALFAMSVFPTPPRSLVVLSILSGLSGLAIMITVFLGKLLWFSLVVFIVTGAPNWLMSLPWLGKKLQPLLTR